MQVFLYVLDFNVWLLKGEKLKNLNPLEFTLAGRGGASNNRGEVKQQWLPTSLSVPL